jgi:hypothetical protein
MAQLRKIMKRKSIYFHFEKMHVSSGQATGHDRDFTIHLKQEIDKGNDYNITLNENEVKQIINFFEQYIKK